MPGQDRTGPQGQGSMTGRGMGLCGKGFRRSRGFGRRCWSGAEEITFTKDQEKKILEAELAELEAEKFDVEKRLKGFD